MLKLSLSQIHFILNRPINRYRLFWSSNNRHRYRRWKIIIGRPLVCVCACMCACVRVRVHVCVVCDETHLVARAPLSVVLMWYWCSLTSTSCIALCNGCRAVRRPVFYLLCQCVWQNSLLELYMQQVEHLTFKTFQCLFIWLKTEEKNCWISQFLCHILSVVCPQSARK